MVVVLENVLVDGRGLCLLPLSVTAWLVHAPENCGDIHGDPMMGSGGLPEGRLGEVGPRMEAGEPLEGRSDSDEEVSIVHGCSGQDLDYPACWPVLAQST